MEIRCITGSHEEIVGYGLQVTGEKAGLVHSKEIFGYVLFLDRTHSFYRYRL